MNELSLLSDRDLDMRMDELSAALRKHIADGNLEAAQAMGVPLGEAMQERIRRIEAKRVEAGR